MLVQATLYQVYNYLRYKASGFVKDMALEVWTITVVDFVMDCVVVNLAIVVMIVVDLLKKQRNTY